MQHPGAAKFQPGAARKTREGNRKLARIDELGVGETLGAYLLQLASSTIQADQFLERMARMTRLFGNQRSLGHAWLGVDFEADEFAVLARPVVEAEIRPRHAPAPKRSMRLEGHLLHFVVNFRLNVAPE